MNIYLNSQVFDRHSNVLKSKHHINSLHGVIKVGGEMNMNESNSCSLGTNETIES